MSERDDDTRYLLLWVIYVGLFLFAYLEADSWIQRSQLHDVQRRVAELESRK